MGFFHGGMSFFAVNDHSGFSLKLHRTRTLF
jgi:hypothetical protein